MKFIYVYTVNSVDYRANNENDWVIKNTSPIPYASKVKYNEGKLTACLGFCHERTKRLIPLNNDYSLKNNDYYILGLTNSQVCGPKNSGIYIYYCMKVEEIITYATAYERFPEWRADITEKSKDRPIPIKPIKDINFNNALETKRLYILNKNNQIINKYSPRFREKKSGRNIWAEIKQRYQNKRKIFLVNGYDQEFIEQENEKEGGQFIQRINDDFSIIYEWIPYSHHTAARIALRDVMRLGASYPFDLENSPKSSRNGDRLFVSYSDFNFFGQIVDSEINTSCSYLEIDAEILKIFKRNIAKYRPKEYLDSVQLHTPRGNNPRIAQINPLIITDEDATELLTIIKLKFNAERVF